jgi:type VI secretion system ImpM family protein
MDQITSFPAGYFGKLPTQGDFVAAGLGRALTDLFDGWLRASIRESQRNLGRGLAGCVSGGADLAAF